MAVDGVREVERERIVQGAAWDAVHCGYFSDPEAAAGLVGAVLRRASKCRPETIADIGGGTGFILSELARKGLDPGIKLVNLDISPIQLAAARQPLVKRVQGTVEDFRREQIAAGKGPILFVMRSVLHYLGPEGVLPALQNIRAQMKPGEYFIHQTACFEDGLAAECLNFVYAGMGTKKRYPTDEDLRGLLEETGFAVCEARPGPALTLTSAELGRRYGLSPARMARVGREVGEGFGQRPGVFRTGQDGWTAWLHYRIFSTRAD